MAASEAAGVGVVALPPSFNVRCRPASSVASKRRSVFAVGFQEARSKSLKTVSDIPASRAKRVLDQPSLAAEERAFAIKASMFMPALSALKCGCQQRRFRTILR